MNPDFFEALEALREDVILATKVHGTMGEGLLYESMNLAAVWSAPVLFVVGVMNLAWVGVLTLFILVEKIGLTGVRVSRAAGAILIALGALLVSGGI